MEFLVFFGLLALGAIVLLFRSRSGTTSWRDSPTPAQQVDTRVKPWTDGAEQDWVVTGHQPIPRVPREEGHGKDGGG